MVSLNIDFDIHAQTLEKIFIPCFGKISQNSILSHFALKPFLDVCVSALYSVVYLQDVLAIDVVPDLLLNFTINQVALQQN